MSNEVHYCEVCGVPTTRHRQPEWEQNYFIPPCCQGCGCQTYEEVDPAERVTIKRGLNDEIMIYCDGVHVCDATAEGGDCIVKALVAQMRGKDSKPKTDYTGFVDNG